MEHLTLPRRAFLAASAAAIVLPNRLFAQRMPINARIGVGFIGMGIQSRGHVDWFLKSPRTQVLAVCDVDTERRENAKKRVDDHYTPSQGTQGCAAYVDYRELLARPDIDAVVISTPDHWHAIQIIDACKAGKDIYCEKPLTLTLAEGQKCIEAVRKHKRVLQTGSQQRTEYDGRFRTAVEHVRNGRLGPIYAIFCGLGTSSKWCDLPEEPMEPGLDWDRWLGPAPMRGYNSILSPRGMHNHYPDWRNYREYSGGLMTDWGAHHFDIAQWALGMDESGPVEITPPRDPAAVHGVVYTYANGVKLTHGGPFGITIIGEKGSIFVDRDKIRSEPESILKTPLEASDKRLPQINNHRDNFVDCVLSREKPVCDVEVGARSIAVAQLGNLAYWNREPLIWNPATWEFIGTNAATANTWRDMKRRDTYALPAL